MNFRPSVYFALNVENLLMMNLLAASELFCIGHDK